MARICPVSLAEINDNIKGRIKAAKTQALPGRRTLASTVMAIVHRVAALMGAPSGHRFATHSDHWKRDH